jgi:hypothetical protein
VNSYFSGELVKRRQLALHILETIVRFGRFDDADSKIPVLAGKLWKIAAEGRDDRAVRKLAAHVRKLAETSKDDQLTKLVEKMDQDLK